MSIKKLQFKYNNEKRSLEGIVVPDKVSILMKINELVDHFNHLLELIQRLSDENEWKIPPTSLSDLEFKLRDVKK